MKRVLVSVFAAALLASPAAAQEDLLSACGGLTVDYSPTAPPTGQSEVQEQLRYLCGQVVSVLTNVQPTIGIGFSGGNPVLGTASTLGRRFGFFPRVSVTVRGNAALADLPNLLDDYDPRIQGGEIPPMETSSVPFGALQGDVALGLFNGFSLGPIGGLGALDLLASVSMLPAIEETGLEDPIINWGAGARIGILKQGLVMPGLSVSGMYRNMAEVTFGDMADPQDDPAEFSTNLSTISLRAAVSKGLLAFDFAAGAGYDIYSSDVRFDFEVVCPVTECGAPVTATPSEPIEGELKTAAWNVFGNVGLSLLVLNVVGEVGYQKASEVITAEDLQEAGLPNRPPTAEELSGGRLFASLGLRFSF